MNMKPPFDKLAQFYVSRNIVENRFELVKAMFNRIGIWSTRVEYRADYDGWHVTGWSEKFPQREDYSEPVWLRMVFRGTHYDLYPRQEKETLNEVVIRDLPPKGTQSWRNRLKEENDKHPPEAHFVLVYKDGHSEH